MKLNELAAIGPQAPHLFHGKMALMKHMFKPKVPTHPNTILTKGQIPPQLELLQACLAQRSPPARIAQHPLDWVSSPQHCKSSPWREEPGLSGRRLRRLWRRTDGAGKDRHMELKMANCSSPIFGQLGVVHAVILFDKTSMNSI